MAGCRKCSRRLSESDGCIFDNLPSRVCENGRPVPLGQDNWAVFTQELIDAADVMLTAARANDQTAASDATNNVAEACLNCHLEYRDVGERCVAP